MRMRLRKFSSYCVAITTSSSSGSAYTAEEKKQYTEYML